MSMRNLKTKEERQKINEKISEIKQNSTLLFREFCYYSSIGMSLKEILKRTGITYKTIGVWRKKMEFVEKIERVSLDRAIREALFRRKEQIQCFDYLKKEMNYWSTYEEVAEVINISRYHYKTVRDYITEELVKINS